MQREKVILIAANPSQLQAALQFLALDRIALLAILMEDSSRNLAIGEMQLPVYPFSVLGEAANVRGYMVAHLRMETADKRNRGYCFLYA